MKIRHGFVSNSSSSSFVVKKYLLSGDQLEKILNHKDVAGYDAWDVTEKPDTVELSTWMDNFDMWHFLGDIGVPMKAIRTDED